MMQKTVYMKHPVKDFGAYAMSPFATSFKGSFKHLKSRGFVTCTKKQYEATFADARARRAAQKDNHQWKDAHNPANTPETAVNASTEAFQPPIMYHAGDECPECEGTGEITVVFDGDNWTNATCLNCNHGTLWADFSYPAFSPEYRATLTTWENSHAECQRCGEVRPLSGDYCAECVAAIAADNLTSDQRFALAELILWEQLGGLKTTPAIMAGYKVLLYQDFVDIDTERDTIVLTAKGRAVTTRKPTGAQIMAAQAENAAATKRMDTRRKSTTVSGFHRGKAVFHHGR